MPYVITGTISRAPIEGGIQISDELYEAALQAMMDGLIVTVKGGQMTFEEPEKPQAPEPEPLPLQYPQFTALEMLDLFTEAEQLAVVQATMTSASVKLWYDRLIAASFVTYEDPRTEGGLQALVDAGLLTPERKGEIVTAMQPAA